jgi:RNA polymerase sigma-70 factor (ECF subfamily)
MPMADEWKQAASAAMDRYACGDDAAFAELYDLLAPRLSSFLFRRTRDTSRTEDLVQQTFLQMHSARRHFSPGAEVTPWAFAIARRLLIDTLRKGGRECLVEDDRESEKQDSIPPDALPDAVVGRQRFADRMDRELARMPEAHRVAFELVQRDGLSMAETAQVLGTTENAVKLRAFRTYEALRAALGAEARELLEGMS